MKKIYGFLTLILCGSVYSQTPVTDTAKVTPRSLWKNSLIGSANLTQTSFTDWAQGGENALAWALFLEGKSAYDPQKYNWANSLKFGFGQARLGTQGIRKTDDKIDLESVLTYKMGSLINPYISATLKTQFAKGYLYRAIGDSVVAEFFDPAYLTQTVGFGYQPVPQVKTRLGAGVREIVTSKHTFYTDDPKTAKVEKIKTEGGLESVTDVAWKVYENIVLTSKLELFAPLNSITEVVVRNDNTLSAKVNKYVSVNFNVQLINEPKVSRRTQAKQTLAMGISYNFL